jgi:hypothetical protein
VGRKFQASAAEIWHEWRQFELFEPIVADVRQLTLSKTLALTPSNPDFFIRHP